MNYIHIFKIMFSFFSYTHTQRCVTLRSHGGAIFIYAVLFVFLFRWLILFATFQFSLVQLLNHVGIFVTPWTAACQASLSITNSRSLHKLISIESVMPSNHLILCHPLLLLPSIFPSIRVFSVPRIRWPKYWSFSFNISSSNEYSGLTFFSMDCLDLPADQGTLKSPLQNHSSKAMILQHSVFLRVQL